MLRCILYPQFVTGGIVPHKKYENKNKAFKLEN
jgi:hypothetical protein